MIGRELVYSTWYGRWREAALYKSSDCAAVILLSNLNFQFSTLSNAKHCFEIIYISLINNLQVVYVVCIIRYNRVDLAEYVRLVQAASSLM